MAGDLTDSEGARRRLDQALDVLRQALVRYMSTLPRASGSAYGRLDLQALVQAFVDRLVELSLPRRARTLAFVGGRWRMHFRPLRPDRSGDGFGEADAEPYFGELRS